MTAPKNNRWWEGYNNFASPTHSLSKGPEALLTSFFTGAGKDSKGRTIDEIIGWDNYNKEIVHDYIQWLFPTMQRSQYNPNAPIPTNAQVAEMIQNPEVISNLKRAYISMLDFYGLKYLDAQVVPSDKFYERTSEWCTSNNHNFARLDRMINSLLLFGLRQEAQALFSQLERMTVDFPVLEPSCRNYWSKSIRN